jgi:hypothetical protein
MAETVAAPVAAGEPKPAAVAPEATQAWHTTFEDADIKGSTSLSKFKGANEREILGAVSKAYVNLEKMPRGVSAPKADAPTAEWDAYYERLGRPKTADEYAVNIKVPEGMPWSKAAESNILKKLHAQGLTQRQAEGVINGYLEEAARGNLMVTQKAAMERDEAEKVMKDEWGGLADMNISLVQRSVAEFGGDQFRTFLDESGLGNNPLFLKFVHSMAKPMLESNMIVGENLGMKRNEAKSEIDRLMGSEEYAGKKGRQAQQEAVARISELYPIAHSE